MANINVTVQNGQAIRVDVGENTLAAANSATAAAASASAAAGSASSAAAQLGLVNAAGSAQVAAVNSAGANQIALAAAEANRAGSAATTVASDYLGAFNEYFRQQGLAPSVIAANGWEATVATPIDPASLLPLQVSRQGFTDLGVAARIADTVRLTKRVRQVFPNQASFTANSVTLEDYIYAGDFVRGATNNSTVVSPKPVAIWGMTDRRVVGNTLPWEIIAFHRDARLGRQVACVRVRATDGTNTTGWQAVSSTSVSTHCEDANPVEVYSGSLDVSGLNNDATITLQGQVMPWFGTSASILDSATETELRFTNRFFFRSTSRLATPTYVYVSSTGNDTTGVVSTNEATAAASPCLTPMGALGRARTVLGGANANSLSGLIVRIVDTVNVGTPPASLRADGAAIIITRAPGSTRAAANMTMGLSFRPNMIPGAGALANGPSVIFEDMTITRTANVPFQGEAGNRLWTQFRNINFNWSSVASSNLFGTSDISFFGAVFTNMTAGLAYSASGRNVILRGLVADAVNSEFDASALIGCTLTRARANLSFGQLGAIVYACNFIDPPGAGNATISVRLQTAGQDLGPIAIVQNVLPMLKTGGQIGISISADGHLGNITHLVLHHNTVPGAAGDGRFNIVYDDTAGTARTHRLISFKGNLGSQFNTKGDVFMSNGARLGSFPFHHGVGCAGNFSEAPDAAGNALSFGFAYPGVNGVIAGGDSLFVDDRAVSLPGPVAGTTGGNYRLQGGSPARALLPEYLLGRDFEGAARPVVGAVAAGAYL